MIPLKDKTNVNAPVGTYPFGASPFGTLRNNPGDNSGTPVDVDLVQDIMIFAEALMASGGIAPNGVLDVGAAPQLLLALGNVIDAKISSRTATEIAKGIAEIATQTEVNTGTDDERFVTALKLAGWFTDRFGAWTLRNNTADVTVSGGSGISVTGSSIKYKIMGKTMYINFRIQITNTTAPTEAFITLPSGIVNGTGFAINVPITVFNGTSLVQDAHANINTAGTQILVTLGTLTNTLITTLTGGITFETT